MISGDSKGVNTDMYGLATLQVRKRTQHFMASHRKCMVRCVRHLNEKILDFFSGSSSATNELNLIIMGNCIHKLL